MNYDKKYEKDCYWGTQPNKLLAQNLDLLKGFQVVVDLGCGEGRDSLFLAEQGFKVIAVDKSSVGLNKIKEGYIATFNSDIKTFLSGYPLFSVFIAMNSLQFINEDNIYQTIRLLQSKTKSKGINMITSFIAENEDQKKVVVKKGMYFFSPNELRKFYEGEGWKILHYKEYLGEWETHGEPKHRHYIVELIAKKE